MDGCREESKASLKSVDSSPSSASAAQIFLFFRDTKDSMVFTHWALAASAQIQREPVLLNNTWFLDVHGEEVVEGRSASVEREHVI